jgi:hypothetical protein
LVPYVIDSEQNSDSHEGENDRREYHGRYDTRGGASIIRQHFGTISRVRIFNQFLVLGNQSGVVLQSFLLVEPDVFGIRLYEALIKNTARKRFIVVTLDRLDIHGRDSGLLCDLADGYTSLFASLSQFFAQGY